MPFNLETIEKWIAGSYLVGQPDNIPSGSLRLAVNVRIDRVLKAICSRAGSTLLTSSAVASGAIVWLSKLFGVSVDYSYAQIGENLYRLTDAWGTATNILATGTQVLSDANFVDGSGAIHKYFVNATVAHKDDGTALSTMGIAAPTAAPTAALLGRRHSFTIDTMDAVNWSATNATAPTNDATIFQIGPTSLLTGVAADTLGSVQRGFTSVLNLDTLDPVIDPPLFSGGGLNNLTALGPYTGTAASAVYEVEIDSTGVNDTFRWRKDGGTYTNGVVITAGVQALSDGVYAFFATHGGHALNARWVIIAHNADVTVKDDDWIRLWIRIDRPERLTYLQIDFDLDTTVIANAFRKNFYSIRLPSLTRLSQGRDQWTELRVRKSEFTKYGEDSTLTWATVRAARLSFLTNTEGAIVIYLNDLELQGGFGIEGDYQYTALYRNSSTCAKGNPALDTNNVVQYTTPLTVARHPVILNVTNMIEGGSAHPGDTQIDRIWAYRNGGVLTDILRSIDAKDTVPYMMDTTADSALLETVLTLETDNNRPPTGTTRVLFGPNSSGCLFLLVNQHRLYFSKPFETNENRCENWPPLNYVLIGDGSQKALAGIAEDVNVWVWTDAQTYFVQGQGVDTFLPVQVPGSRGVVGQFAVCAGNNRIYFVSQDGVYAQENTRQFKLTGAIDPFFHGETVDGQTPLNTSASALAEIRLLYHHDPYGSFLIMLYPDSDSTVCNRQLILKPNIQTGELTDCFFDSRSAFQIRSIFIDHEDRHLLAGGNDGHVYLLEDRTTSSDNGTAIAWQTRTKSLSQEQPFHNKTYAEATIEGNTNSQNITVAAYYNNNASSEILTSTFSTSLATSQSAYRTASETTKRKNVSFDISGSTTSQVTISRVGVQYYMLPQAKRLYDTSEITFATLHELRRVLLDVDSSGTLTLTTYRDGVSSDQQSLAATSGRQRVDVEFPLGLRSKNWRFTLEGSATAELFAGTALYRQEPPDVSTWDSDEIAFPDITLLKRLRFEIDAPANVTVTVFVDGMAADVRPLFATDGRVRMNHRLPAGLKGRVYRINCTSASKFQVWNLSADVKPVGNMHGYTVVSVVQTENALISRAILQAV